MPVHRGKRLKMSKTWRKVRRENADQTFKKPQNAPKRQKQALARQITDEQEEKHGYR